MRFMKALWIALAALLVSSGPVQAQAGTDDTSILDDCNAIRREIEKDKTRYPAHALFIEGVSRFYGYCHRRDRRRGLEMAERGVKMGHDGQASAIGEMYLENGDRARAETWFEIAAMVALFADTRSSPSILNPIHLFPRAQTRYDELRRALAEPDLEELVATLERMNGRAPILARAEGFFWRRAAEQLRRAGRMDWFYWQVRYDFVHDRQDSWTMRLLEQALLCGEPRTVREYAARYLDARPPLGDPRKIAEGVARLHLQTGSDGELLARVEARLGHAAYESPEALRQGVRRAANECSLIAPRAR